MTLKTKQIIFNFSSLICMVNFICLTVLLSINPNSRVYEHIIIYITVIIIFILSILIQIYYKKSLSSEIILLVIFLFSLSMQYIRILAPLFKNESFIIPLLIAKMAIFFKYLSFLSILGASLFSFSIKKQKLGSWVIISIITSLVLSAILPFNTAYLQNNLLPNIIFKEEEMAISIAIIIMTVITFIKSGFDAKNNEYIHLGIASLLMMSSFELMFINLSLIAGIGIWLLLIVGTIIYLKSMHNIMLWG